jgi:hypothetical protein
MRSSSDRVCETLEQVDVRRGPGGLIVEISLNQGAGFTGGQQIGQGAQYLGEDLLEVAVLLGVTREIGLL